MRSAVQNRLRSPVVIFDAGQAEQDGIAHNYNRATTQTDTPRESCFQPWLKNGDFEFVNELDFLIRRNDETEYLHRKFNIDARSTKTASWEIASEKFKYDYFPFSATEDFSSQGVACWRIQHISESIQPQLMRAREVIIGAPWN